MASGGAGGLLKIFAAKRKGKAVPGKPDNVAVWLLDKRMLLEEKRLDKKVVERYCAILKLVRACLCVCARACLCLSTVWLVYVHFCPLRTRDRQVYLH